MVDRESPSEKAERLVLPILKEGGYDLVRVKFSGGVEATLQVMIERKDRAPMTVDDCVWVSRAFSDVLEEDDISDLAYHLEVTSPGVERPLVREEDYDRFKGECVLLRLIKDPEKRKKIKGILLGLVDGCVHLETSQGVVEISLTHIKSAQITLMKAD